MTTATSPTPVQLREVDPETARRWLDSGDAVLVDVREPDENAFERIRGSKLVPLSKFDPAAVASSKKVIIHCKGGKRSAEACRLAIAAGYSPFSLSGGIEGWKAAGHPTERGQGGCAISVLRQTQMTIGAIVLVGTAATYFVDPRFAVIPAFMGAGLVFAGASGTCGMMTLISKLPWNRTAACSDCACE